MSGKLQGEPLDIEYIEKFSDDLKKMTKEELITIRGLNLDRADVIIPALKIYIFATRESGAKKIYVPKIGVSDGITRDLYHRKFRDIMEGISL
jgi:exopolyphosphatase/guanosine-5'-triphosphate,3'-diphosphate pyrophosphatase